MKNLVLVLVLLLSIGSLNAMWYRKTAKPVSKPAAQQIVTEQQSEFTLPQVEPMALSEAAIARQNETALIAALNTGDATKLKELIDEKKIDVNKPFKLMFYPGQTPLQVIFEYDMPNKLQIAQILLAAGAHDIEGKATAAIESAKEKAGALKEVVTAAYEKALLKIEAEKEIPFAQEVTEEVTETEAPIAAEPTILPTQEEKPTGEEVEGVSRLFEEEVAVPTPAKQLVTAPETVETISIKAPELVIEEEEVTVEPIETAIPESDIIAALQQGDVEEIKQLISKKLNVNKEFTTDYEGKTPLQIIFEYNFPNKYEVAQLLINAGADKDSLAAYLNKAARLRKYEDIQWLLNQGVKDIEGRAKEVMRIKSIVEKKQAEAKSAMEAVPAEPKPAVKEEQPTPVRTTLPFTIVPSQAVLPVVTVPAAAESAAPSGWSRKPVTPFTAQIQIAPHARAKGPQRPLPRPVRKVGAQQVSRPAPVQRPVQQEEVMIPK